MTTHEKTADGEGVKFTDLLCCPCCQEELKPCPFCGKPAKIYGENNVGCSDFQCSGQVDFGHWCGEENGIPAVHWVIKAWNRRAT